MTPNRWLRVRLFVVAAVLSGLLATLGYKAFALQVRDGDRLRAIADAQHLRQVLVPAPRGAILDAQGAELAVSVDVESAFVNPPEVVDVAGSAAKVARALRLDVREVESKLASPRQFEWLRRRLDPDEAAAVRKLALPGIGLAREPRRFYPGRTLAASVLGAAGMEGKGLDGIELSLDQELAGKRSRLPVLKDRRGDVVLGLEQSRPEDIAGAQVILTLDRFVQFSAERALAEAMELHKARAGVVVVLDARTSEVLAMASWPTFDPNLSKRPSDSRNRPVVDAYEPGSVMKIFSYATAIEAGVVTPETMVDVEGGKLKLGRRTITDTHKGNYLISVAQAFKESSNVAAIKLARKVGREGLHASLQRFGFGQKTGIELPGDRAGTLHDPRKWGEAGLATVSYGYGMTASPLQIAAALVPIANGGLYQPPRIVKRIIGADGEIRREHQPQPRRVMSEKTSATMRDLMRGVFDEGGTGAGIRIPGFTAGGKTGTAYRHSAETKGYSKNTYLSSFIGFAPAADPRVVVLVIVDEPRGTEHYGGKVAGPVFARVVGESLQYLGVPASADAAPAAQVAASPPPLELPPETVEEAEMSAPAEGYLDIPDFTGLTLAEALALARERGITLDVVGSGKAVEQFPPAGRARKSIACRVTFDPG